MKGGEGYGQNGGEENVRKAVAATFRTLHKEENF